MIWRFELPARHQGHLGDPQARSDRNVLTWLAQVNEDRVFLSVITIAEITRGVALLAGDKRRTALAHWLEHDLPDRFGQRMLIVDQCVAFAWAG